MRSTGGFRRKNTGNRWSMKAVFRFGKFSDFFRCHPTNFLFFPTDIDHKASKKIQKFSKLNTTSVLQRFPVFPPGYDDVFRIFSVGFGEVQLFPEIGIVDLGNFLAILQQYHISEILQMHPHLL
jgi:hypothetical protein